MAFDVRGELAIGGEWVDATGDLLKRQALVHRRGRQDQASRVDPSSLQPLLNNTNGQFSPDNPMGPYYGQFGRNTPFRLSVRAGTSALGLDGSAVNNASTPDDPALDITGDIDVRWEGEADWYAAGAQILIGKWGAGGNRSYHLRLQDGLLTLHVTSDGTIGPSGGAYLPAMPRRAAVRGTVDIDNGSGGATFRLYWATSMEGPWAQAGGDIVVAGAFSVFAGTAPLTIAPEQIDSFATRRAVTGRCYRAEVRAGIDGPVVAAPDFTAQADGTASFVDSAGRTWTMAGTASITNRRTRLMHELAAYPARWHPSGEHAWVEATTAGVLRRLRRGSTALQSTLRRRIPSGEPLAYWPMEDGATATQAASALDGGTPLAVSGLQFQSDSSLPSSEPLPVLGDAASLSGSVPGAVAGGWHVEMVYKLDKLPTTEQTMLTVQLSPGTGGVRQVRARVSATAIKVEALDGEDAVIAWFQHTGAGLSDFTGEWNRLQIFSSVSGSQARVNLAWRDVNNRVWWYVFAAWTGTPGRITGVRGSWGADFQGMAVGHLAAFDVGGTTAPAPGVTIYEGSDEAFAGETAGERMERLAEEEAYPVTVHGLVSGMERVGPQSPSPILELLEEAADADGGILYEDRERLSLRYRGRSTMYNQVPALVLDYTQPGLAPPLEPTGDDDATENDITVTRANGSSARAVLEEGPLSVQAPPAGVGSYPAQVTLNLYEDSQTEPQAYWRLHHGTYEGRRYPQVRVMVHAAPPELLEQILMVDVGDRVVIRNPPVWVAPEDVELIVQGYEETFRNPFEWDIIFNCSPGQPWQVGAVEDTLLGRVDTDGSQLAAPAGAADTTLLVQATAGPEWVTTAAHPAEFPFDIRAGGEVMTVTAIADAAADAFGRTVASGWGVSDTGQAWTTSGGAASDYAVGSGVGSHTMTSTNLSRRSLLTQPSADFDLMVDLSTSVLSTGGFQSGGLIARAADSNNLFLARLEFTAAQAIVLTLRKRLTGTETVLGTYTLPLTHAAATYYRLRFQGQGSALRARAWRAGDPDPVTWQVTATDTDLAAAAEMGVRSILSSSNTNTSPVMRYDNLRVVTPQRFTVTRAVNGVVKAHTAGTDVRLATPMTIAL